MRLVLALSLLPAAALAQSALEQAPAESAGRSAPDSAVVWTTRKLDTGDWREARFTVRDGSCAYRAIADPDRMGTLLDHLEGVVVHADDGHAQDLTLRERFVFVGLVESRYDRQVDGHEARWTLTEGRQKRHDGSWLVAALPGGGAAVRFENTIEARSALHQPLLRLIQTQTMAAIVEAVQGACGVGP